MHAGLWLADSHCRSLLIAAVSMDPREVIQRTDPQGPIAGPLTIFIIEPGWCEKSYFNTGLLGVNFIWVFLEMHCVVLGVAVEYARSWNRCRVSV